MGHNYVVAHVRKVPTAVGLLNVAAHNCREAVWDAKMRPLGETPDYISHPDRAGLNEGDRCGGEAVLKRRTERIREADLTRKPQKNAAVAVEFAVSASPGFFAGKKPHHWRDYFRDCREFLAKRYGEENLLHWAVHYDEKTPHMHVLMAPIVKTEKGLKYSSSEFLGGRVGLRDLQTQIAAVVGREWGLERGLEGSRARHTDQYTWSAELAQERDNLALEKGGLDIRAKEADKREATIAKREASVTAYTESAKDREKALTEAEFGLGERLSVARAIEEDVAAREKAAKEKARELAEQEKRLKERDKALSQREGSISEREKKQREFEKARDEEPRKWRLPEPGLFESAGAYEKRIANMVDGWAARLTGIEGHLAKREEELIKKEENTQDVDRSLQQKVAVWEREYSSLKRGILSVRTAEELDSLKRKLGWRPDRERDGFER